MAENLIVTGNTEKTKPENRVFYPALDGLRGVAFLMVFVHHYLQVPWGWAGVDLFFVLSGFLITGILFDSRGDAHRVRNFYVRRTLRIFPLYFGIMLAILVTTPLWHWQWNWKWVVWPLYLGNFARYIHPYNVGDPLQKLADFHLAGCFGHYCQTFYLGHLWSLCVEEQFYLVWPWLVFWIRDRRKLIWVCAATVPICLGLRLMGEHFLPGWMLDNEILSRLTPLRLDALLTGGLIALVLRGAHAQALLRAARKALPFALVLTLLWLLFTPTGHLWQRPYPYPESKFTWGLSAFDVLSALLLVVTIQPGSRLNKMLSLRPLRWIGRISYGAYILHDIPHRVYADLATWLVQRFEVGRHIGDHAMQYQATALAAVIALAATFLMAWLSFRFFESPFLNLKERWTVRDYAPSMGQIVEDLPPR